MKLNTTKLMYMEDLGNELLFADSFDNKRIKINKKHIFHTIHLNRLCRLYTYEGEVIGLFNIGTTEQQVINKCKKRISNILYNIDCHKRAYDKINMRVKYVGVSSDGKLVFINDTTCERIVLDISRYKGNKKECPTTCILKGKNIDELYIFDHIFK